MFVNYNHLLMTYPEDTQRQSAKATLQFPRLSSPPLHHQKLKKKKKKKFKADSTGIFNPEEAPQGIYWGHQSPMRGM